jgi:hypothetical protein
MGRMKELFMRQQEEQEKFQCRCAEDYQLDDAYWAEQAKWQELYEQYEKEQLEKEAQKLFNDKNK